MDKGCLSPRIGMKVVNLSNKHVQTGGVFFQPGLGVRVETPHRSSCNITKCHKGLWTLRPQVRKMDVAVFIWLRTGCSGEFL
jgi:hypothetical protein